jgi:GNAT superfamily N-acetyltransferase
MSPAIVWTGPATPEDVPVLSQVVADAFHPLAVSEWLIPDEDARRDALPSYWTILLEHAISTGVVVTTADRDAAALWLPVQAGHAGQPLAYQERLAKATGEYLDRFTILDEQFEQHHPAGVPHEYLSVLAVRPDRQGHGLGTGLLTSQHAILDRRALPSYLVASGLDTRQVYLGHGYADHGRPVELPDGPRMYPMWRAPRLGAAGSNPGALPVTGRSGAGK